MTIKTIRIYIKKFYDIFSQSVLRYRRGFVWALSLAVALIAVMLYAFGTLDKLELLTLDWRFNLRRIPAHTQSIVFIDMAEDSIKAIGRWPWPRKWHAALIKILNGYRPKAIAFDVVFSEPQDEVDDLTMEEALKESGSAYLPMLYDIEPASLRDCYKGNGVTASYEPLPQFKPFIKGTGHINAVPDKDGILRRVPAVIGFRGRTTTHFGVRIGADALGVKDGDITFDPRIHEIRMKMPSGLVRRIPLDGDNQLIVNWLGPWGKEFRHVSFIDIIKSYARLKEGKPPLVDMNVFRDKVCIIGLTASGLIDIKPTPVASAYPAVGTNAMVISGIIDDNFIKPLPRAVDAVLVFLISFVFTFYMCRLRFLAGMVLAIVGIVFYAALSAAAFAFFNIVLVTFYPSFGIFLSYAMTASYVQIIQSFERARLFRQATRDGLTQLYNIRHFNLLLEAEFRNCAATGQRPLSIIMADLDDFKRVNDTFGHQAGDTMLREVAHVMRSKCRQADAVARYGGEEFVMMLVGAKAEDAADVGEKIRSAVGAKKFKFGEIICSTTISIGVAEYTNERAKDALIEKADKALYEAKQTGKDRVCLYSDAVKKARRPE